MSPPRTRFRCRWTTYSRHLPSYLRRHCASDSGHILDQVLRPGFEQLQLPRELPASFLGERPSGELGLESAQHLHQPPLDLIDMVFEENERAADLLQSMSLSHHLLDHVDSADHLHRIEALAASVLALASHPAAARQQSRLNVLAERGLGELDALGLEDLDNLSRRHSSGEFLFDPLEFLRP